MAARFALIGCAVDGTVRLWRLDTPEANPTLLTGHEDEVVSVAFCPDGATIASASDDQTIALRKEGSPTRGLPL